jgi:hypothetical protein
MEMRGLCIVIGKQIDILIAGDGLLGNMLLVGYKDFIKSVGSGWVV